MRIIGSVFDEEERERVLGVARVAAMTALVQHHLWAARERGVEA